MSKMEGRQGRIACPAALTECFHAEHPEVQTCVLQLIDSALNVLLCQSHLRSLPARVSATCMALSEFSLVCRIRAMSSVLS